MKATASELLSKLPGPVSAQWPQGERFARAFAHGSMSVEFYAPIGDDQQTPHAQDELYVIHSGKGDLVIAGERHSCAPGDVFFVPAGVEHRFNNFSPGFSSWVVFWGPRGGEHETPL
jgi:mannose-6-phosphate isomerase-like protein (cupin superfamily)